MLPPPSAHPRSRSWWWVFGALIALPATVLAVLGVNGIRADEIERRRQLVEQRQQFARLTDTALAKALDSAAAAARTSAADDGSAGTAPLEATFFLMGDHQVLTFPVDRVYTGSPGADQPPHGAMPLPPETRALVAQAQAAEAQGRRQDARETYERLRASTELGKWAEWRLSALSSPSTESMGSFPFASSTIAESTALSPSGIPMAILVCATAEHAAPSSRRRFAPLLQATLISLRAGRWWLALEQRRFYDGELRRWLAQTLPGEGPIGPDARLDALTTLASNIGRSFAHGEHLRSSTRVVDEGSTRSLLRWLPRQQREEGWSGVAIRGTGLTTLLSRTLGPLIADQPFDMALNDGPSHVWGPRMGNPDQLHIQLQSLTGWGLTFAERPGGGEVADSSRLRQALNYARVAVPLIVLTCGLIMTMSIMRRELLLARLQSTFLSAVTHEFKSPITAIRLLMERLSNGHLAPGDSPVRYHRAVSVEVDRLENLVNRLLDAQRLQSGQKRYTPVPVSLPALVSDAVTGMRPQADAKRITLSTRSAPHVPTVHVDVDSVSDAVRNLVDNAIKYSPSGTTVEVGITVEQDRVAMSVADEGVGLDTNEVSRLFEPFYRGRRGDRANVHGTGLGLALVKATVEAHGGSVTVVPRAPHGSCFTMLLPISRSPSTEAAS
jgi:signal transduction histidine kinase